MQKKQKLLVKDKIIILKNIITNNINALEKYRYLDIINSSNFNSCNISYEKLYNDLDFLQNNLHIKDILQSLQKIINELSLLIMNYGSYNITDLISITIGNSYLQKLLNSEYKEKFLIINKFLSPISYSIINWTNINNNYATTNDKNNVDNIIKSSNKSSENIELIQNNTITEKHNINKNNIINDNTIINETDHLECLDLGRNTNIFIKKIYGINIVLHDENNLRTILVSCLSTNININCINFSFIKEKIENINKNKPVDDYFQTNSWFNYFQCLTLKDILIYNEQQLYDKFIGYIYQINLLKQNNINEIINEFIGSDNFYQRKTLMLLLIYSDNNDFKFIANLLYDLLSNENLNYR